ncbi:Semaphorin-3C [Myotis brandtii]|uniref:Semaphorin-3C n=1 Tax=Myotis brandtii TaxID=109478 RepID=S7NG62_MYOBR|nr:Semaphorin-3C [Myotis brandtii]
MNQVVVNYVIRRGLNRAKIAVEHNNVYFLNKKVKLNERIIATSQGLLIRSIQDSDQGLYHCIATENSFKQTIAKINFKVLNSDMVAVVTDKWSPWTWASSVRALSFHPKDLMGAFSHSEMQMINQYCKDTRQQHQHAEESQKMRGDYGKLKALINSRKKQSYKRNRAWLIKQRSWAFEGSSELM